MIDQLARGGHAADADAVTVVATGGLAPLVLEEADVIDVHEPWLTLIGLRLVYELNATGSAIRRALRRARVAARRTPRRAASRTRAYAGHRPHPGSGPAGSHDIRRLGRDGPVGRRCHVGKDLESLVAPTIMAIIFVAVVVVIVRAQNPRRRAEARARERAAEQQSALQRPGAPPRPLTRRARRDATRVPRTDSVLSPRPHRPGPPAGVGVMTRSDDACISGWVMCRSDACARVEGARRATHD